MRNMLSACPRLIPGLVVIVVSFLPVLASPPARVSYVEGTAAVAQEGDVDWLEISLNMPVREADRIILQDNGLLELEMGAGNTLRLGPGADAVFDEISSSRLRVSLTSGALILRIREPLSSEIITPSVRLKLMKAGLYRVGITSGGGAAVVVRKGEAEAVTEAASRTLTSGDVVTAEGEDDPLKQVSLIDIKGDFDVWSDRRDAARLTSRSASYVGNGYAGTYDLDRYGDWDYDGNYGWVWWPSVSFSWGPYRVGEWQYYPSWGWTWVSYEPWGWLPYHYGRWVYSSFRSRWCWSPYDMTAWSPALVLFYSSNNSIDWAPRTFDDDRRGNRRIIEIPRAGLNSESRDDFLRRARFRGDRRSVSEGLPLPGTGQRIPVPGYRSDVSAIPPSSILTIGGNAEGSLRSEPTARRDTSRPAGEPRVVTVGPSRPSSAGRGYLPARDIQRLPPEALLQRRSPDRGGYSPRGLTGDAYGRPDAYRSGGVDRGPSYSQGGWWIPASPSDRPSGGSQDSRARERIDRGRESERAPSYDRPAPRRDVSPDNGRANPDSRSGAGREAGGSGSRTPRRDR